MSRLPEGRLYAEIGWVGGAAAVFLGGSIIDRNRRIFTLSLASLTLANSLIGRGGMAMAADKIKPDASSALIVVDVQNCFLPGGSVAVKDGDQVVPVINRIANASYLKERAITVFVTGLATDFCVAWTAIDARHAGFTAYLVEDACRGIDAGGSLAKAWADMNAAGVTKIQSSDLAV